MFCAPSRSGYLIAAEKSFTIIEEADKPVAPEMERELRMATLFRGLLADQPPGPPLIGNNLVFYALVGGILLSLLLPMILWLRRRHPKELPSDNINK
jgi:hypothetical protein